MNIFTNSFSAGNNLSIVKADQIVRISIKANGGDIQVLGNTAFKNITPGPITLHDAQGITLDSQSMTVPIDGVLITPGTGNADVLVAFG